MSWLGSLLLHLLTGVLLLVVGFITKLVPIKSANYIMGYRTSRSMKNQDTWREANTFFPGLMIKTSILSILIGFLGFIFMNNETSMMISAYIPVVLMFYIIYATEKHLKATFDKEGNRLNK